MRILCVIHALVGGGAEKNLVFLSRAFAALGHHVEIAVFRPPPSSLEQDLRSIGIEVHSILEPSRQQSTAFIRLGLIVRGIRHIAKVSTPDIILSFMDQTNLLCLLSTIGRRIPVIVAERVNPAFSMIVDPALPRLQRFVAKCLRNVLYRLATSIAVQTKEAIDYFPSAIRAKCMVIPNPVLTPVPTACDKEISRPSIVGMGRLVSQKGFDCLIRAFGLIARSHADWDLYIVGEGAERQNLHDEIQRLKLQNRVKLVGQTATPDGVFQTADIFVLSSRFEGFPGVLAEAMANGCACISTDCAHGPSALIRDGKNGLLVAPDDAERMGMAIAFLIENPAIRTALGLQAKDVTTHYSPPKIVGEWLSALSKCIPQ